MKVIIAGVILLFLCIFFVIIKAQKNKKALTTIKIKNVEEKINSTLLKRKELIKDSEEIIKSIIKTDKNIYENLSDIDNINNIIELDRRLMTHINEFYIISNRYKKLKENAKYQKLYFDILETEDLINAYKDYYNDIAIKYNKILKTFPFLIMYKIKGEKEKLFFERSDTKNSELY